MMLIDWEKLAQIEELKEHFEADFSGFQQEIETNVQKLQKFSSQELDKLALLRVLEVTNGCIQWGFRRQDEGCLSVEQARECMKKVIGFIKNKKIIFPDGELIEFPPHIEEFISEGRDVYHDAFKRNVEGAQRKFYSQSTAQFIVYGHQRLYTAMDIVKQNYESLFTPRYLQRGCKYITPYLEAYSSSNS